MLVTLLIGYSIATVIGVVGFLLFGGVAWVWGLSAWIGGAIACICVAAYRLKAPAKHDITPTVSVVPDVKIEGGCHPSG